MTVRYGFHPDALTDYAEAAGYYRENASAAVAEAFVTAIEAAIREIITAPKRWRIVEEPGIRRYVLRRFPYVLYYRMEAQMERIVVYAVMHGSRSPDYWKARTDV